MSKQVKLVIVRPMGTGHWVRVWSGQTKQLESKLTSPCCPIPLAALAPPSGSASLAGPGLGVGSGVTVPAPLDSFAILAGTSVSLSSATTVTGNVGAPVITNSGTISNGQAITSPDQLSTPMAQASSLASDIAALPCTKTFSGDTEFGHTGLLPGVYCVNGVAKITTGLLVLDAQGNAGATFVIKAHSFIIRPAANDAAGISLGNGARICRVFLLAHSATNSGTATIAGTGNAEAVVNGTLIADQTITVSSVRTSNPATVNGRLISLGGSVITSNSVSGKVEISLPSPTTC